jgi:hypothetical protein
MHMLKRGCGAAGIAAMTLGLVVACGGGGGSVAGIDRLGVTTGSISGFGSVIVNGVEYDTDDADFDIDDGPGSQSDLRVGQRVKIQWDSSDDGVTRNAQSVSYDDLLEGPIDSIDPANQRLVILGQDVIVDAATSFDDEIVPRDLTGLELDDVVEVSGLIDANGAIRATRIDFSENSDDFEVRGRVESLDPVDRTFIINNLTVDYLDVLNPPVLSNGLFVEVEGDSFDAGTLFATRVEIEDDDISGADEGDDGELEGYITDFVSATDFSVSGVAVTTNGQTTYEDGVVGDLALNVKVEVEGEVNSSGVLVARQVEFKSGDDDDDGDDDSIDGSVAGNVTAVNAGAGTLAIAGVAVTVTAETRYEDQTGIAGQFFGLDDIAPGNYVEVRGDPGTGATLTAVILERDVADIEGLLRGPASAVNGVARTLSVLGVPVTTDSGTQYRDDDDNAISAEAFFAAISNGSEVEVQFTQSGGAIVADELELEDSDD